jgi:thioredoxin-like negative regulator of GroEL
MRIAQDNLPAEHPHIAGVHSDLGALYTVMQDRGRGERHLRESLHEGGAPAAEVLESAVAIIAGAVAADHPRLQQVRRDLAEALIRERRFERAESILRECEAAVTETAASYDRSALAGSYIRLYEAWQKPEQVARWRDGATAVPSTPEK